MIVSQRNFLVKDVLKLLCMLRRVKIYQLIDEVINQPHSVHSTLREASLPGPDLVP